MKFQDSIRSVLSRKGPAVHSVPLDATVFQALNLLAHHDVGALLVTEHGQPVGMFSERDYARKVILLGRSSMETSVQEVMSKPACVAATDTVDSCLHLMTTARVRHLVVMGAGKEADRPLGIVSIGDLVNWVISTQDATIHQLSAYLTSGYPG